jgi:hypothetical protein
MGDGDASAAGSGGGDPQRLKRIAAGAYDYENDARWAGYWSNVLVPPHLASRSDVVDHFKRKFYQRYIVSSYPQTPTASRFRTLYISVCWCRENYALPKGRWLKSDIVAIGFSMGLHDI